MATTASKVCLDDTGDAHSGCSGSLRLGGSTRFGVGRRTVGATMGVKGVSAAIDGVEALEVSRTVHTVAQWGVAPRRFRHTRSNTGAWIRARGWMGSGGNSRGWRRCGHAGQGCFRVNPAAASRRTADESSGEPIAGFSLSTHSAWNGTAGDGTGGESCARDFGPV